jgi:site-specific DNA recombinase
LGVRSGARDRELKRLEEQHRRVQTKLEAIYEDRLEGRISKEQYDRKRMISGHKSLQLLDRMNEMRLNSPAPVEHAIDLMDLTSRAADLFLLQPTPEKQHFLRLVLKSATWQDGWLHTEFEDPFESLRRSNQLNRMKHSGNGAASAEIQDWLPSLDAFRTFLSKGVEVDFGRAVGYVTRAPQPDASVTVVD